MKNYFDYELCVGKHTGLCKFRVGKNNKEYSAGTEIYVRLLKSDKYIVEELDGLSSWKTSPHNLINIKDDKEFAVAKAVENNKRNKDGTNKNCQKERDHRYLTSEEKDDLMFFGFNLTYDD